MTTKAKSSTPSAARTVQGPPACLSLMPAWNTPERLLRIQVLGERINKYVQFMCEVGDLNGTSAEAKDRAVAAFYERLVALEEQLGRIQESLQLG